MRSWRRLYTKAAQDAASFRGKLYSAPFASSSQVLFYNRALFKAAGVEPPTLDVQNRWTWERVVDAARKMSDPAKSQWGFVIEQAERPDQLLPFGQSLGRQAISEDGLKASGFIDGQPFVDGFTFMQRLYTDWKVSPPGMFDNTLTPDVFGSGRAAMFLGDTFSYDTFSARYKDLDRDVAPHPYFEKGRPVTPTGSWHISMNPRSRNKEAAAAFIRHKTSDDAQALWFKLRPYVPVLQSSWTKQAEILDSPQWRIAHHELDNTALVRPATPGYREYEDVMRVALRDITAGADVKTQLSQAAQRIDRELQKYRA